MKINWEWVLYCVFFAAVILGSVVLVTAQINRNDDAARANYTAGYCAALNGTSINSDTCNVDGQVVEVPK